MGWYDTYHAGVEACDSASDAVGTATGAVYGFGTEELTGNHVAAAAVDRAIGGFVGDHWTDSCHLLDNLGIVSAPDNGGSVSDSSSGHGADPVGSDSGGSDHGGSDGGHI